ncbi:MAG: O-antigen ligase family protein [Patescibacteria group bacterium]
MIPVLKQFFDRNTAYGIGALLVVHAAAWLTQHTVWSAVPFTVIVIAALIITKRSLVWGLAFATLEIFIGGHGHLIDVTLGGTVLGIRQGIFLAVMLGTMYHLIVKRVRPRFVAERDLPFVFLAGAIALGTISGFARNSLGAAFDDMNGYATFAYLLPVAMITWTQEAKRVLLWTFALGATWVAASSLLLLFLFTHLPVEGIWALYGFVRDARLAEVTILSNPAWLMNLFPNGPWYFRVFEQGQFTVMMFTLVLMAAVAFVAKEWKERKALILPLALMLAVDVSGQSRSFWLGLVAASMVFVGAVLWNRTSVREVLRMKSVGAISLCLALLSLWVLVVLPVPPRPDLTNSPYYKGQNDDTRDLAVSSRWNLIGPMMEKIGENPLWGSGFGTPVTYISDDPRIRAMNGTGEYTTYRFEWGYQDIWLKMGVPGLLAFGFYLFTILRAGYRSVVERDETRWLSISMVCGIIALYASHVFSPYLNHPIGLGFMIFVLPFFVWRDKPLPTMDSLKDRIPSASIAPMQKTATIRETQA